MSHSAPAGIPGSSSPPPQGDLQLVWVHRPVTSADPKSSFFSHPLLPQSPQRPANHQSFVYLPETSCHCQVAHNELWRLSLPVVPQAQSQSKPGSFYSLGTFKMPFSWPLLCLITGLLFTVPKYGVFSCFIFFFINSAPGFALRANHKDAETHEWLLTRKCKGLIQTASASAPIPSPAHPSSLLCPSGCWGCQSCNAQGCAQSCSE